MVRPPTNNENVQVMGGWFNARGGRCKNILAGGQNERIYINKYKT